MSVYRRPGRPGSPVEDGDYEELSPMVQAIERAARALGEPVLSADRPKSWRIGFAVGPYWWGIRPRDAGCSCPEELREHVRTRAGRVELARMMTQRAGV